MLGSSVLTIPRFSARFVDSDLVFRRMVVDHLARVLVNLTRINIKAAQKAGRLQTRVCSDIEYGTEAGILRLIPVIDTPLF